MELKKKYELPRIKFVHLKGCDVIASSGGDEPMQQSEDADIEGVPEFRSIWNLALLPFVLCLMLGVSSCKDNELPEPPVEELVPVSLSAEVEKGMDDTRVKISDAALLWENGDKISLFDGKGNREFTYSTEDNKFHGKALANQSYQAIYPYSSEASAQSGTFYNTVTVNAEQQAIDGNFDKTSVPMIAYYSDNKLHFRWAYSLLKIGVQEGFSYSKIEISNYSSTSTDSYLAGTATIANGAYVSITKRSGSSSITLVPAAGKDEISKGNYYISILPCKLTGLQITCYDTDKIGIKSGDLDDLTINRHEGFELGTIDEYWFTCQAIDIGCIFEEDGKATNYYIADRNLGITEDKPNGTKYSQTDKVDPATVLGPGWELPSTNVLEYWAGIRKNNDAQTISSSFDEVDEAYKIKRDTESLTVFLPAPYNDSGNYIGRYWGNDDQLYIKKMSDTGKLSKEIKDDSSDAFIRPVFPVPVQ